MPGTGCILGAEYPEHAAAIDRLQRSDPQFAQWLEQYRMLRRQLHGMMQEAGAQTEALGMRCAHLQARIFTHLDDAA